MTLAHPGWLALLILLPILGVAAVLTSRLRGKQWTAFMAPRLRNVLLKSGSSIPRWLAIICLFGACAALTIALARPRADAGTRTEKTLGRNVMIALDISRSMKVADVKPDRMAQAKVMIYELMESMPGERVGFIGFAGNAYLYAPLTIDHTAVRETIEQIDETWAPLGGSDLASAVELATDTLKKTGQKNNALIIFSDGEKHNKGDLEAMISEAERSGVHIVAIGVGTENGDYVPNPGFPSGRMVDREGKPVISRLQPDVLRKLAEGTKGKFAVAGSGFDIPALVKSVVEDLDTFEMEGLERRVSVEFYQWLVFPAVLFLFASIIAGTRWKGVRAAALLLAGFFLTLPRADASEASRAKAALEGNRFEEAKDAYQDLADKTASSEKKARYHLGEATAAYRSGDFREARTAYSEALLSTDPQVSASGHLGMGNSLFQLGWKGLSGERYPEGPDNVPDMAKFDELVKDTLAKMIESEATGEGDGDGGGERLESLVTNWADSVRHYDSSLAANPSDSSVLENRRMTVAYLKRLRELLKQEEEEGKQALPQGQPGEGQPNEGEDGEEGDDGKQSGENGEGQDGRERPGGSGNGKERKKDGKGGDEDDKKGKGKGGQNPNESPEDRARRILRENADRENGPLSSGRREFRDAAEDW